MKIAVPAILPSSHEDLKGKLSLFTHISAVERIQIDIVDGTFAQPASWPYTAPREMRNMVAQGEMLPRPDRISYEMDLMCADVERAAEAWLTLGVSRLTFHAESVPDLPQFLAFARKRYGSGADFATGLVSFGVALNIESDLALIEACLHEVEYVQFMGIAKIGRQGEPLDDRIFEKVHAFHSKHPDMPVQIDGGVTLKNAKKLISLGVTNLVVGSALAHVKNLTAVLAEFEDLKPPFGV